MDDLSNEPYENVKAIIQVKRMTVRELSNLMKVAEQSVSKMLSGTRKLTDKTLVKISEVLNVPFDMLRYGKNLAPYLRSINNNLGNIALGAKLKELRDNKGLTQAEVGSYLNMTKLTISLYELGVYLPLSNVLASLAKLYGVTIEEISSGSVITNDYNPYDILTEVTSSNKPDDGFNNEYGEGHELLPKKAKAYLQQAIDSIIAPAGSVMLSASAVDAMLKEKGYKEGSLYERIDKAAEDSLLTKEIATWAHQVRLDTNSRWHPDEEVSLPTVEEAKQAIEFTKTLAEFLFLLPAKITRGIEASKLEKKWL